MNALNRFVAATALATTAASSFAMPAEARTHHRTHYYYRGQTVYAQRYCRPSSGTAGLIAGGVGGALLGKGLVGHGLLGTAVGALGGAFAGRAVDRTITAPQRCYYR